jgi:two-component system sensor histidine kinase EvgS
MVDPLRIKQVLSNLLSNAIKFTDRGEVHTSLQLQPGASANDMQVELCVRDTGIGISAADQARLFSAFAQADGPRAHQGAGLGLVISRTLAELMGGKLHLQSVQGVGTRVNVKLQLPASEAPPPTDLGAPRKERESKPLSILVVDDYPANLLLLEKQLNTLGHRVTLAEHGEAALALWQQAAFDLVITDCSMPVMDGHELTRRIRQLEHARGVPACRILGVTANAQAEERQRCLASGMDECLFKPIGLSTLKMHLPQVGSEPAKPGSRGSGFHLNELRHLTQGDPQLTRHLLEQLSKSASEDLAALRALGATPQGDALGRIAHRIKGGAKMLKVRGVVSDCEAVERAQAQGLPTEALQVQLEASLMTLQRELADTLSAIAASN